jgi:aryl-alcohol dehydrogenase-like predicted oxidoreductase
MKMRRLGASGLLVSEVGLGCNNFGSRIGQDEAVAVVDAALNAGITFFDTADVYGRSQSEVLLGGALGKRRKDVVIATKFGLPLDDVSYHRGGSRRWIMEACERSLKRLGTDYIDLYQQHGPDEQTPIEETLRALDDLIVQGKIRYAGSSGFNAWQLADADWTARQMHRSRFISTMNLFSLLERNAKSDLLPACEKFGIGFLPYFPLAAGLLTGKYRRGAPPPPDARLANWGERGQKALADVNLSRVEALQSWAEGRNHSLLELAFSWLLSHSAVASVIAGATRPEQVASNVAAAQWEMTADEIHDLDELFSRLV